ncbi:MAG: DUF3298 and DUF4163 domain-containing protein [Culturomica sp.]|jgi:hypothetical protein|nr:DUF3298 and DUF4163 domain-containing protein [Culturomica sp.]
MEKSIFWTGLIAVFLLCGCKSRNTDVAVTRSTSADQGEHWKTTNTLTHLASADKQMNEKCARFNARIQQLADSLRTVLAEQAALDFSQPDLEPAPPIGPYELIVTDTLFSLSQQLASLRVTTYTYTGGAHGGTDYYIFNYDLDKGAFLAPEQLMDFTKQSEINGLLSAHFNNSDGCFTDLPSLENGFTAFNIGKNAVCFTYPPYILGPSACGTAEVFIPKTELAGILRSR